MNWCSEIMTCVFTLGSKWSSYLSKYIYIVVELSVDPQMVAGEVDVEIALVPIVWSMKSAIQYF